MTSSTSPIHPPSHLVVKAAYGKLLLTKKDVLSHLQEGKDFQILSPFSSGTYCSKTEIIRFCLTLEVRYGKNLSKLIIITPSDIITTSDEQN